MTNIMDIMDKRLSNLESVLKTQGENGNWNYSPYMMGVYNGLALAHSIMHDIDPVYKDFPDKWLESIIFESIHDDGVESLEESKSIKDNDGYPPYESSGSSSSVDITLTQLFGVVGDWDEN